jgi:hypothetical protein
METAMPAASSSGDTIFDPEDNLDRDLDNMDDDSARSLALLVAGVFVLITITDPSVSHPLVRVLFDVASLPRGEPLIGRSPLFTRWLFLAACRHCLSTLHHRRNNE